VTYLRSQHPRFAFLIHPRDLQDLYKWRGSKLLRDYSTTEEDFLSKATSLGPVVVGEILFGLDAGHGELLGVARLPDQILGSRGGEAIAAGVRLAAERGAPVVGLGALTAPRTGAGLTLLPTLPRGLTLTTGNAYTAAVARANVVEAVTALSVSRVARVAILGATGSVGVPASHLLVQAGLDVTLIGRTLSRLRASLGDLGRDARFSDTLADLRGVDIVLALTSSSSARLSADLLSPGSMVIDVAQPANVPESDYGAFRARQVRVVAGGLVRIPRYGSTYDFSLADPTTTFACLAETYLMAREGIREHSVGPIATETALRMERIAQRHGVRPATLQVPLDPRSGSREKAGRT